MDLQKPNKHGVYTEYENREIPLPSSIKGKLIINIAHCQDGKYRTGYHYEIKGMGGGGGAPSVKGQPFDTIQQAILHVAEGFLDKYQHDTWLNEKNRRAIIRAIDNFIISNSETEGDDLLCDDETCPFRTECMKQPPDPDALCLAKVAAKKKKPGYVYGWKYGGDGYQLYIQLKDKNTAENDIPPGYGRCTWWPTHKIDTATRFRNVEACIKNLHVIRPDESKAMLAEGRIQFFVETPYGIKQVSQPLQQPTLF